MDNLVYSTDGPVLCQKCGKNPCLCRKTPAGRPAGSFIKVRLEKNGRGGKTVTVIFDLPRDTAQCEEMTRHLKKICGTGGTFKNSQIEIQGDHRENVKAFLEGRGYGIKFAGG